MNKEPSFEENSNEEFIFLLRKEKNTMGERKKIRSFLRKMSSEEKQELLNSGLISQDEIDQFFESFPLKGAAAAYDEAASNAVASLFKSASALSALEEVQKQFSKDFSFGSSDLPSLDEIASKTKDDLMRNHLEVQANLENINNNRFRKEINFSDIPTNKELSSIEVTITYKDGTTYNKVCKIEEFED